MTEASLPKFPDILPDKIKETFTYITLNGDFYSKKEADLLMREMFLYPERTFYLYVKKEEVLNKYLRAAKDNNSLLMNECEFFYYKHPDRDRDFIKIGGGEPKNNFAKDLLIKSTMYKRFLITLTEQKKRELAMNRTLKVAVSGLVISILIAIITWIFMFAIQNYFRTKEKEDQQKSILFKEQKIASGLFSELLLVRHQLKKGMKDITRKNIDAYLASGEYLPSQIHTQISNFSTSINDKNYVAAREQVDDIISMLEKKYGCRPSKTQSSTSTKHPAVSADIGEIIKEK